jgi:glycosyltransferase involved in cell wall biosynthesis
MSGVLLVTTSYPGGGQTSGSEAAGSFVADFCRVLSRRLPVAVVAPSLSEEEPEYAGERLTVIRYPVPSLPLSTLRPLNPLHTKWILGILKSGMNAVQESVKRMDPDHMLAMWALPTGYWARSASGVSGIAYSTWSLGSDIWSLSGLPVVSGILKKVLRDASHRFADGLQLSSDVESICGRQCGFLPSSRVIRTGSIPESRRDVPPYRLSFLGRWHLNKGVDILLDALLQLDDTTWDCISDVRIHGGGPLEELVGERTERLVSSGRPVASGGYMDRDSAERLYMSSDFVVIPSRIESIPLVFSDAMQCGVPVICTPAGDLPRLLDRFGCGISSSSAEPSSLASAITSAVTAPRTALARGTAAAAGEFTPDAAAETFIRAAGLHSDTGA